MSEALAHRCNHHPVREAVARCPSCRQFFCRDCITEHDDAVICTTCLRQETRDQGAKRWSVAVLFRFGTAMLGLVVGWYFFFGLGKILVSMPSKFHEGTIWKATVWDDEP